MSKIRYILITLLILMAGCEIEKVEYHDEWSKYEGLETFWKVVNQKIAFSKTLESNFKSSVNPEDLPHAKFLRSYKVDRKSGITINTIEGVDENGDSIRLVYSGTTNGDTTWGIMAVVTDSLPFYIACRVYEDSTGHLREDVVIKGMDGEVRATGIVENDSLINCSWEFRDSTEEIETYLVL